MVNSEAWKTVGSMDSMDSMDSIGKFRGFVKETLLELDVVRSLLVGSVVIECSGLGELVRFRVSKKDVVDVSDEDVCGSVRVTFTEDLHCFEPYSLGKILKLIKGLAIKLYQGDRRVTYSDLSALCFERCSELFCETR